MKRSVTLFALIVSLFAPVNRAQLVRETNTTLRFPPTVTSAPGTFEAVELFPGMSFEGPVCVATPPGDTRLFVVERFGRIWVITNLDAPTKTLFMDISGQVHASSWVGGIENRRTEGLSSIAFHPAFASNHRFFVTYNTVTTTAAGNGHHNRVAEFRATNDNTQGIVTSEIPLITQYDEGPGHNINDLHFGPDGYLYIVTGDEGDGGVGDDFDNAQKIDKDFFSGVLRIDVDKKATNLTANPHPASNQQGYKIPADNPYIGLRSFNGSAIIATKIRTEFFAVGLRNPWRFSFDPLTQKIYEGDVGQHEREEINQIVKGGNYGWPFKEGTANGPKIGSMPAGFNSIAPIDEYGTGYGPDQGFSVTGGVVYRGDRLPGLSGNLIYGDYESGNIWAMNIDAVPPSRPVRLFGMGSRGTAGFGYDPRNGDVLIVHNDSGKIFRIQYSSGIPDGVPLSLDQTGIFADLATLRPNRGIYPYDVNSPLWSDNSLKRRWFSIPGTNRMRFDAEGSWTFPNGSVWVKHFDLETKLGDPSTAVRVETRVLVKNEGGVYGLTYKWNTAGTAATLVEDAGDVRSFTISAGGTNRTQNWVFPSRAECLSCHTAAGGRVLAFNTAQLNRDYGYGSVTTNQLAALSNAGFLENPPAHPHGLRALAAINDNSVSRTYRVRSYLQANCGQCHQPAGSIHSGWDSRTTVPLSQAEIVNGPLLNSSGVDDRVIVPGRVDRSAILKRMTASGKERMPPLGTSIVDAEAVKLISDWVTQDLPSYESFETWRTRVFGNSTASPDADADGDGASNYTEYLMGTNPQLRETGPSTMSALARQQGAINFRHPANRGVIFEWSNGLPSTTWTPVDDPQNKLLFPAQTATRTITEPLSGDAKYYRMRVIEP